MLEGAPEYTLEHIIRAPRKQGLGGPIRELQRGSVIALKDPE